MVARLCWSKIIGGQGLGFHEWPISEHITVSVTMEKPHSVEQLSQSIVWVDLGIPVYWRFPVLTLASLCISKQHVPEQVTKIIHHIIHPQDTISYCSHPKAIHPLAWRPFIREEEASQTRSDMHLPPWYKTSLPLSVSLSFFPPSLSCSLCYILKGRQSRQHSGHTVPKRLQQYTTACLPRDNKTHSRRCSQRSTNCPPCGHQHFPQHSHLDSQWNMTPIKIVNLALI